MSAPLLNLPLGTQVVLRIDDADDPRHAHDGHVACLIASGPGADDYLARLNDGSEVTVHRRELVVRKQTVPQALDLATLGYDAQTLDRYVLFRCITGSRAYGLDAEGSDVDRRGFYLPPAELDWSLAAAPEQLEDRVNDEVYWEAKKFIALALKANPTVLECLFTPLVEYVHPLAEPLLAARGIFVTRLLYQTYNGYVMSQFKKLEQDMRTHGQVRPKHAMHLIRLLLAGIEALESGSIPVRVSRHRDDLLAIKHGQMPWPEVNRWRLALHGQFDRAFSQSSLPEQPDYRRANTLLIDLRKARV